MGAPGCDDAPVISVSKGIEAKRVTFIYPYYENPLFLERQIRHWARYPLLLRQFMKVIIVDDGSPKNPALNVVSRYPYSWIKLFRIGVDVRWNWLAARNIGAHKADDGWLLLTDMDHLVPLDTFHSVLFGQHDPKVIYRFSRREHTGEKIHPHPNSWLMTRKMYWKVGGYDEALSGFYGTDGDYRRRCVATASIRILTNELERHEYVKDSSTVDYQRKQPEDAGKKRVIQQRGSNWRPKVLSFPYSQENISSRMFG